MDVHFGLVAEALPCCSIQCMERPVWGPDQRVVGDAAGANPAGDGSKEIPLTSRRLSGVKAGMSIEKGTQGKDPGPGMTAPSCVSPYIV